MLNSAKIKIVFPNGEIVKCDDLIALTRNYSDFEEFQQLFIGEWSLEDILDNRLFLSQLFENQIKGKLSDEDRSIFNRIISKQEQMKEELKSQLSPKERELYDFLYPEGKIFVSGKSADEVGEDELMDFFEELLDDLENEKSYQKEQKITFTDNIIDLEEYREKKSYSE